MNRRPNQSRQSYDSFTPIRQTRFKASSDADFFEDKKQRSRLSSLFSTLLILLLLVAAGNFMANRFIHIVRESVPVTGLIEAFDGFTLLHISDLKGTSFGKNQSQFRSRLKNTKFDAVLLTGDMVSSSGDAQPLFDLLDVLAELRPKAPVYFIAGDQDPVPASMNYAASGSPFAEWILGAQTRGATLLNAPQSIEKNGQRIWFTTISQLNLDLNTMQPQFESHYMRALASRDPCEIQLAEYQLQWLESTRTARSQMSETDALIALSHVPPNDLDLSAPPGSLLSQLDLVLCGHYLGGMIRLPLIGPVYIPSQTLDLYGLFPGNQIHTTGLTRINRTQIYTSPGAGSGDPLYPSFFFRLFNPPTVTLLELTPSSL